MDLVDDTELLVEQNNLDEQKDKIVELSSHTHKLIAYYKATHPPSAASVSPKVNCSSIYVVLSKLSNKYLELVLLLERLISTSAS